MVLVVFYSMALLRNLRECVMQYEFIERPILSSSGLFFFITGTGEVF